MYLHTQKENKASLDDHQSTTKNLQKYNIIDNRPASIQLSKIVAQLMTCNIAAGNKGTSVELDLKKGEETGTRGSIPSVDPAGWEQVQALGRTGNRAGSVDQKFVRFHLWNHNAGGPGDDTGNLTTTTGRANNNGTWNPFEKSLKENLPDGKAKNDLKSNITVEYGNTGETEWEKDSTKEIIKTDNADYPTAIEATLDVNGKQLHNITLGTANGVYGPESLSLAQVPGFTKK